MTQTAANVNDAQSAQAAGITRFLAVAGGLNSKSTESTAQIKLRAAYTVTNLFVNVNTNTINTGNSVLSSRNNSVAGNLSITIAAGVTGTFEDTTNSDSVTSGNPYDWQMVTSGTSGTLAFGVISANFASASAECIVADTSSGTSARNSTFFNPINGSKPNLAAEAGAQYTLRFSATFSNLAVEVSANGNSSNSTMRSRVGGVNGNQVVTITGSATGYFEDTTNTDAFVSGNAINTELVTGVGSGNQTITITIIAMHVTGSTNEYIQMAGGSNTESSVSTMYLAVSGDHTSVTTESQAQLKVRGPSLTLSNFFVNVTANAGVADTFNVRKNGANGNETVTVGSGATGVFEDTTNTDSVVAGDLINYAETETLAVSITFTIIATTVTIVSAAVLTAFSMPSLVVYQPPVYVAETPYV